MSKKTDEKRRGFIKTMAVAGAYLTAKKTFGAPIKYFKPMHVDNPLASYPNRDWEKAYRNIFKPDSTFVFMCAPNDTHNCLLKGYVKNDVVTRIGPSFGYGKAEDLYGNKSSGRWDPRICQKGLALGRRIYGDRRVKAPMIRKGFKDWVDAGFPRNAETGKPDVKFFQRGKDKWLRMSWDEAYDYSAKAFENIARTYSGKQGEHYLTKQGYDPAMVEAVEGAGVETIKLRGGMAFLGATRIYGLYRFANSLALMDAKVRNVTPDKAHGARGWDSYSWHTDLPPGHPMVTGMQTNDFDLFSVEHSKLIIAWGMNWITTKMPDSHWMTEARIKGAKTVAITVEYSATASKCDEAIVIRPGTDPAFALGLAQVIVSKNLFDKEWVAKNTDLPFLVRMDNLQVLRPEDVISGYTMTNPKNLTMLKKGEKAPPNFSHKSQMTSEAMAKDFAPFMVWDTKSGKPAVVTRDDWGPNFAATGISPDLFAEKTVKLVNGKSVKVRTSFNLLKEYMDENMTPAQVEKITGSPAKAVVSLAQEIAKNPEKTIFATGMGPNQFFNADLKDRAIFLVAALTRNIGFAGGNVGSYAGNYRMAIFNGVGVFGLEDPFNLQLSKGGKIATKKYTHYESLHYFNYGDRPLRVGNKLFTTKDHMPTPTKAMWLNNSNSVIGNIKWHYDVVVNTLPKLEFIAYSDWWWTGSCEYSDIVFACDSWAEFRHPDMTASCSNPFVQIYPVSPIPRVYDTKADIEIIAGVSNALAKNINEPRLSDAWKFTNENNTEVYLQRIIDATSGLKGYDFDDLHEKAKKGIPALVNNRTYPRISSFEQAKGEQPWHTKSGRLEFYRHEAEWIEHGENIVVHREPVDSTPYEPNVIVAKPHDAIRPKGPESYGMKHSDMSSEARQVRNVVVAPDKLTSTQHPLKLKMYTHVYHTPKYRHGAHSTPVDTDFTSVWFGPFGDVYRHDKRMPSVTEGYVDINPSDARAMGINDGDYVWIDADPEDRPYRGFKGSPEDAQKLARLLLRARFYPGTPKGIARTWHNMYGSTYGSMKGSKERPDGLAKNPETNYQSMYRSGSHQSATRAWLRPTLMTDSLVHKDMFGQQVSKGFAPDIHCPIGAPREAFVKISKAELGGLNGVGMWRPAALGFRPTYENQAMKEYLKGRFMKKKG